MNSLKIYNYSFLLVAVFPLLSLRCSTNLIIIWGIVSLYIFFAKKAYKEITGSDVKNILILSAYYLFLIGNYLLFGFDSTVLKFLETSAPFLIFPVFIVLNKNSITRKMITNSLLIFFIANVFLASVCWITIVNIGYQKLQAENNFYNPVFRNLFSDITGIHLPYLGLLFVSSIFIGVKSFFESRKSWMKLTLLTSNMILLLSIVTFSARMALIIFVIITLFLFVKKLKGYKNITLGLMLLFGITLFLILQTPIKKRVDELLNTKLELPSNKLNNKEHSVNFRYGIYYCSYQIIKSNFWLGVGKHEVMGSLNKCYDRFSFSGVNDFKKVSYNSHNQYLDILLSYGIFGLIILFSCIFYGIYFKPNLSYQVFLIIVFLGLFTENLFERQLGVVFFTFFNTLFFITNKNNLNEKSAST